MTEKSEKYKIEKIIGTDRVDPYLPVACVPKVQLLCKSVQQLRNSAIPLLLPNMEKCVRVLIEEGDDDSIGFV